MRHKNIVGSVMPGDLKEQKMFRHAALREFANKLKHELKPEEDVPDRLRELIAQLEVHEPEE
jgi:hypothetical protein